MNQNPATSLSRIAIEMTRTGIDGSRWAIACTVAALCLSACVPAVRVARVDGPSAYRAMTVNALSGDYASDWSRNTVNEWGLLKRFDEKPEIALAELREIVTSERGGRRELFALAEFSFLHAEETGKRPYYLAAAVYAYAYLFPNQASDSMGKLDPRRRIAADLYNRAITTAFQSKEGGTVVLAAGKYALPFGEIELTFDPDQLHWGDRRLGELTPLTEIEVIGMRNRHRIPGLGAAMTARAFPREGVDVQSSLIAPGAQVAATLVLRIQNVDAGIASGRLRGSLDLYKASETETITMEGREMPLEIDETGPIAVQLAGSAIWKQEFYGFFGRSAMDMQLPALMSLDPYRPGRIPVVFVHGTESSPARWADMANDLLADPWIRQHYQFWYFFYESGNPIAFSAMLLRDKLTEAVGRMDPMVKDRCLREAVVIGHSQGGMLTKLTAVDTGDRLWNTVFRIAPDKLPKTDQSRELLQQALIIKPVPFVHRLIFIATPHRGSFLAKNWVNDLLRRLIQLPATIATLPLQAMKSAGAFHDGTRFGKGDLPTSVDNMTPGNPFLEGYQEIPVAEGVPYHSIIAVKPEFPIIQEGDDGVVKYASAHLEGAASELVVRTTHSTQSEPQTIQEVRRILHVHGDTLEKAGFECGPDKIKQASSALVNSPEGDVLP
ncbi:MAG: esterase/lipase family protein [Candidatus Methylumidiphilus sp.]